MIGQSIAAAQQLRLWATEPKALWTCSDDYETPEPEAKQLAALVGNPYGAVIDAGAGTGNISRFLPKGTICLETNPLRLAMGRDRAAHCEWVKDDFTLWSPKRHGLNYVSVVAGNPPFSLALDFINHALSIIHPHYGRVVFILPSDTFNKVHIQNGICFPYRISRVVYLKGRVSYLKNGKPQSGRQIADNIWTIQHEIGAEFSRRPTIGKS